MTYSWLTVASLRVLHLDIITKIILKGFEIIFIFQGENWGNWTYVESKMTSAIVWYHLLLQLDGYLLGSAITIQFMEYFAMIILMKQQMHKTVDELYIIHYQRKFKNPILKYFGDRTDPRNRFLEHDLLVVLFYIVIFLGFTVSRLIQGVEMVHALNEFIIRSEFDMMIYMS
jgi:hypothetical protein